MALSSIGDLARGFSLKNQTASMKAELDRRSLEATTGRIADVGQAVSGDFTPLAAIDASLARLGAYHGVGVEATLAADTVQSALATVSRLSVRLGSNLLSVASPGSPASVAAVSQDAVAQFRTAVATLNTTVGDRSLFSGTDTRSPALAPADDILNAVVAVAAGAADATAAEAAIGAWFSDPAGFATIGYTGGRRLDPLMIASGETVAADATADDPALRDTLKALAMAAVLDRGVLAGDADQRARLARRAGEALLESETGRTTLAARIGTAQERISDAQIRNGAETTALTMARTKIVSVDAYEAATALTSTQTELETLYAITSRLSKLTLANFL